MTVFALQTHANDCFRVGNNVWHKVGLCWKQLHAWLDPPTNISDWLIKESSQCVCVCECSAHIMKSLHCVNQLPQPLTLVGPRQVFYFTERVPRLSPLGALMLFLGRPLNDHCLAASQIQPSHSLHWVCLNRCPFSHNTPSASLE